jgi:cytochrome P450
VAWIPRFNTVDVEWEGLSISAGTPMFLGIMAANRDPDVFPDPHRFDVRRRPAPVLTFGFGAHFCLGAALARSELDAALQILLRRLPGLRLTGPTRVTGTIHQILRGPDRLPVAFDTY